MNTFTTNTGQTLYNVHAAEDCTGPCPIHRPTDHHMLDWPLTYRYDRGIFERHCRHGIGHPDPDSIYHAMEFGNGDSGVHGCDGCCVVRTTMEEHDG